MTQFEKELKYVKSLFEKIYTQDELSRAQRAKREFIDMYILVVSQTDLTFIKIQNELNQLEVEAVKRLTSAYRFN